MALDGVFVLLPPGHSVLVGHDLAGAAHVIVLVGIPEAVVDHGVDRLPVPEAHSLPHLRKEVGAVGHRFHPAGDDDLRIARGDPLGGQHHGLQARATDLVDRQGGDLGRQAGAEGGLARGSLPEARGHDVAQDDLVDRLRPEPGAGDRLLHHHGPELGGREALQGSQEPPGGQPNGREDHRLAHRVLLRLRIARGGPTGSGRRRTGRAGAARRRRSARPRWSAPDPGASPRRSRYSAPASSPRGPPPGPR